MNGQVWLFSTNESQSAETTSVRHVDLGSVHYTRWPLLLSQLGITIGAVIGTVTNALKATGKALGKGLKRHWLEARFHTARADWLDCELSFQGCRPGHRVSCRAHLADYSRHCRLSVRKISQEAPPDGHAKSKASPTAPMITAVLLISCCGVVSVFSTTETVGSIFSLLVVFSLFLPWPLCVSVSKGGCLVVNF